MNKKLKKTLIVLSVIILVALAYGIGTYASTLKWNESAVSDAWLRYANVSKAKNSELTENMDAIIWQRIEELLSSDEVDIETALEAYFNSKIDDLEQGELYQTMKQQIESAKTETIEAYKREIDKLFSAE
jgi:biopolymer transport protein ExbB/TolQ